MVEGREKELSAELRRVRQTRIEVLNNFQCGLAEGLPELGARIQQRSEELEVRLQTLHQEVRAEAESLQDSIQKQQQQRQKNIQNVQEMISRLAQQIKGDLEAQRRQRESSRVKLLSLFQSACGRLNLL